jgi:hypothetical protein
MSLVVLTFVALLKVFSGVDIKRKLLRRISSGAQELIEGSAGANGDRKLIYARHITIDGLIKVPHSQPG